VWWCNVTFWAPTATLTTTVTWTLHITSIWQMFNQRCTVLLALKLLCNWSFPILLFQRTPW
jgi:hypothetical protein